MGTYSAFKTDSDLEKTGIELDLGSSGVFQIARAGGGNQRFTKRLEALTKPHRRAIQSGAIDTELARNLMVTAYVDCIVLGWEGVTDENGNGLPFSKENAMKLFTDLPDLFATIQQTAEDASLYRSSILEIDSGN